VLVEIPHSPQLPRLDGMIGVVNGRKLRKIYIKNYTIERHHREQQGEKDSQNYTFAG
jgi:hypothetical protein